MRIITLSCPACGANLEVNEIQRLTKCFCKYCGHTILLEDERAPVQNTVKIEGISTDEDLLNSAQSLLEIQEYLPAMEKFKQYAAKYPSDYRAWLGLFRARTRDFTVADSNALFKLDVEKYYNNYMGTAPEVVKTKYAQEIYEYFHPEIREARMQALAAQQMQAKKDKKAEYNQRIKELKQQARGGKGGFFSRFKK